MRGIGGDSDRPARGGPDSGPSHGHVQGALQDLNEDFVGRGMLAQSLAFIESEEGHIPSPGLSNHTAGDSLLGVGD